MSKTIEDIREEGGTCEKIATDFWECTDKDGKVWWCSDGGKVCVEKPMVSTKTTIDDLIKDGAKCVPVSDDLTICRGKDGTVWACQKSDGSCAVILPSRSEQKCERYFQLTHAAMNRISNESLRYDFFNVLEGVDYALNKGDVDLANVCIERIRVLAHSLCRTIGGSVAVAIIDGLAQDGGSAGQERLIFPDWKDDLRCDTDGSRSCVSATRSRCHSDSAGCISHGQDLDIEIAAGYVWGVTLV